MAIRNSVLRSIADHPWTSLQDGFLGLSAMAVAGLLALEYDLFRFAADMTTGERRITLAEAVALTLLLAGCIAAFVHRRLTEQSRDLGKRSQIDSEMRELRELALRDPLTNLPNRRAVLERLEELRSQDGRQHAFFMLDLNEFKRVNDGHGHSAGDGVLQVIAERFKRVSRPTDLLARLGGDEFAVVSNDVDLAGATAVGMRLLGALENKVWVQGVGHDVGVSIGAVMIPQDGNAVPEILANADIAMYRAKATDRSALVFFDGTPTAPRQYPRFAG
ncbi:MAG: GGDEF domain-containing protein [Hyphomicrobium sp.]